MHAGPSLSPPTGTAHWNLVVHIARLRVDPPIYGDRMTQVHRTLDPDGVPAAVGGYSHTAVVPAGTELLFVAGQVPEDLDGSVPDGFADQARLAWRWLIEIEPIAARPVTA